MTAEECAGLIDTDSFHISHERVLAHRFRRPPRLAREVLSGLGAHSLEAAIRLFVEADQSHPS